MSHLNRRQWLRNSLLASSGLLFAGRAAAMTEAVPTFDQGSEAPLRLNANENPYGPPRSAVQAMAKALNKVNRYPMTEMGVLKEKLAEKRGVTADQLLVTSGSTEVLSLLGQHVGLLKGEILTPWPSFLTMLRFGEACGASVRKVPTGVGQHIDLEALLSAIKETTTLVYVCNPNNPTSLELDPEALKAFCRKVPPNVLICVDEAYIEYTKLGAASSMVPLINELPNLIVCRTFSKAYGLAGLRLGYALSDAKNITAIRQRHTGWELANGAPSIAGAMAALDDEDFIKMTVQRNEQGRKVLYKAFDDWGVKYMNSATNFVYASTERFGEEIATKLREQEVMIAKWRIMEGHMRISIARPQDMQRFVELLEPHLI